MIKPLIHLLTSPADPRDASVVCGDRRAAMGTWQFAQATCAACLSSVRAPCTCAPGTACPACHAYNTTHPPEPASHPPIHSEKAFQDAVCHLLKQGNYLYYHTWNSRHSPAGFPDLVAIKGPKVLFAELKLVGKQPTSAQQRWLTALSQVEHVSSHLWTPTDLEDIATFLAQ